MDWNNFNPCLLALNVFCAIIVGERYLAFEAKGGLRDWAGESQSDAAAQNQSGPSRDGRKTGVHEVVSFLCLHLIMIIIVE